MSNTEPATAKNVRPTVVIYHKADFDGIFSREIARKFLGEDTVYVGWDYGDVPPMIPEGSNLYMIDISVESLMNFPGLVWIDHHKSAIEKYNSNILGYRIDGVAACRLAWQWFNNQDAVQVHSEYESTLAEALPQLPSFEDFHRRIVDEPWAVRLAGEYDVWDKRDPNAELFQFGLKSEEITPEYWSRMLSTDTDARRDVYGNAMQIGVPLVNSLLNQGRAIKHYQEEQDASVIRANWFRVTWEGLTFLCCNHARFNSHLFDAVIPDVVHDALLGFRYDGGKGLWVVSMYHSPGGEMIDLSEIAVKYGGGGHRGACGFVCSELPFELSKH